ncbi:hypothetical protein BFW01_g9323 [Lasiodiplodia theobromae]|nr:hypothetical protein BFW01_g9323 [Lasiodiplodia theobromae]
MELRTGRERRAPRRFQEELDRIYAPEVPEQPVIRPASRPARPLFETTSKPFNPRLPPAAFPTLPPDNRQSSSGGQAAASEGSRIVKLKTNKDALCSVFVSLRDLVKREDSREEAVWSAKQELRSVTDINNGRAFMKGDVSYEEQYDTHLTLSSMEEDTNCIGNPETALRTKIDLSELHHMVRCTILMNMYIDALKEGFQNPLFPIQRLLNLSAEDIMQALDKVEKAYLHDDYPDCMSALAMAKHILQARRFLVQQKWPWRFLDHVDLAEYTPDRAMQMQHAHAPEGAHNMPAADLLFFGRRKKVQPKDVGGTLLAPRDVRPANDRAQETTRHAPARATVTISFGSQEHSQRRRLRLEEMTFAEGAAQEELQRLRLRGRQGQSLPSGKASSSEKYFQPQLVYSPSMPKSNIFTFPVTVLNQSPPTPSSPDTSSSAASASSSPREMLFPTAPSSPPPSDLPSAIYGPPSVECSEAEVLKMLGAATTAAISHSTAFSSSPMRGEASDTPAARSTPPDDDVEEKQGNIIPVRPIRVGQQLITQTPPSTPTTMELEPSSPSLQRQQRQMMRRRCRPPLRLQSSSASAMLMLFERNYHRRIQEQQAAQAFVQVGSLRDVLTPREDSEYDQRNGHSLTTESGASITAATSPADHYYFSPGMTPQPSSGPGTPFFGCPASSRSEHAPSTRFNFSFSRPLPSPAATAAVATPPSSVPVAPMMSTQTAATADSSNGHSMAAARPLPASKKSVDKIEHVPLSPSPLGKHLAAAHPPHNGSGVASGVVLVDDEGEKKEVVVVDGGQVENGVPFKMFMEGVVECAESD